MSTSPPSRFTRRLFHSAVVGSAVALVVWVIVTWVTRVNPVDFLVYRYGAEALLRGADLYAGNLFGPMMPVGGMPFTYTPFAAVVFAPTALFDPRVAYLLWSVLSVAIVAWAVDRFTPATVRHRTLAVAGVTVLVSATAVVTQHISFGQVNLPLMALVLCDLLRTDTGRFSRWVPRGLLVGVAAAIKLTPALFIVYLLVTRQWRAAAWAVVGGAGATIAAFLLAPAASIRFFTDVLWTLDTRVDFGGGGFASYGNNSLQGIVGAAAPGLSVVALPLVLAVGLAVLLVARGVHRRGRPGDAVLIVGLAAPLLSPISWIHHWVYLVPAAVVLLHRGSGPVRVAAIVMIALLVPGPGIGEQIIRDLPALAPFGWIMRESLAVASVVSIVLLAVTPRRHPDPPSPRAQTLPQAIGSSVS